MYELLVPYHYFPYFFDFVNYIIYINNRLGA